MNNWISISTFIFGCLFLSLGMYFSLSDNKTVAMFEKCRYACERHKASGYEIAESFLTKKVICKCFTIGKK